MRRVALLAHDPAWSTIVCSALSAEGLVVEAVNVGRVLPEVVDPRVYAAAVVASDCGSPEGCSGCRELSARLPVIWVLDDYHAESCVRALACGADDCVPRTITMRELAARVRNVLRRAGGSQAPPTLERALTEMRVHVAGSTIPLTKGETEVLAVLAERAPTPVTAAAIATALGSRRGTIEARIKSLRRKLGTQLVTRGRLGYEYIPPHA